eukprot:g8323.t1
MHHFNAATSAQISTPTVDGADFHQLIELNADGIVVLDEVGAIQYVNPAAELLFGRDRHELRGLVLGIPMIPGTKTEIDIIGPNQKRHVAEVRVVQADWENRSAILVSLRDVTERKRAVDFLVETSRTLSNSLDYATTLQNVSRSALGDLADWCLVDLIDGCGNVRRSVVAHSSSDLELKLHGLLGVLEKPAATDIGLWNALESGDTEFESPASLELIESLIPHPDHRRLANEIGCESVIIAPLTRPHRNLGAMTFVRASTGSPYSRSDLELAEDLALRSAIAIENALLYDDAQQNVRRRDEFLAMLAHELRNPLAPILHAAQLLRHCGDEPDRLNRVTGAIDRQARHMKHIIDDLLDISRVTRGRIELDKQRIDIQRIVDGAMEMCQPQITDRGHRVYVNLPDSQVEIYADPTRLTQILDNLISNAAKYTDPGGDIGINISCDQHDLIISVCDSGIGIAADMLPKIFDLFTQLDQSLARSKGGLGIGLTLVRTLAELHGGRVSVESEGVGRGSEFVVRLPLPITADMPDSVEHGRIESGARRILLVEDLEDVCEVLREILEISGHQVITASNGLQGISRVEIDHPDVALIDIGLPGIDGYEVARRIRANADNDGIALIAVTGYGRSEDRDRAFAAGFDDYIVKPRRVETNPLELLIRANADGMIVIDKQGVVRFNNPAAERILGFEDGELLGSSLGITSVPVDSTETDIICEKGGRPVAEFRATSVKWGGEQCGLLSVRDITARKETEARLRQVEAQLRGEFEEQSRALEDTVGELHRQIDHRNQTERDLAESEDRFRLAFEQSPVGKVIVDGDDRIVQANRAIAKMFGVTTQELLGKPFHELAVNDNIEPEFTFGQELREGDIKQYTVEKQLQFGDGDVFDTRVTSYAVSRIRDKPIFYMKMIENVSERRRIHALARRQERLAAIGTLAAGIAHEINNPAGAALLSAETAIVLLDQNGPREEIRACLDNIVTASERCGRIIRNTLRFAQEAGGQKQPASINDIIRKSKDLIRMTIEYSQATVELHLDEVDPLVTVNELEMELVVVNLIKNAIEANSNPPRINVETCLTDDAVQITVEDNGRGLTPYQKCRAFDPFFTTRQSSGGTGLGLSIVHGIVEDHHGTIELESEEGKGTTVCIRIPVGEYRD